MNRCSYVIHDSKGGDLRCQRLSCHTGKCLFPEETHGRNPEASATNAERASVWLDWHWPNDDHAKHIPSLAHEFAEVRAATIEECARAVEHFTRAMEDGSVRRASEHIHKEVLKE